jgi:hypothetical protein
MRLPSAPTLALVAALALLPGCGDEVRVATAGGGTEETRLEPEQLTGALATFSLRIEERVGKAADAIDRAALGNDVRRQTLQWRIRTAETVRSSLAEPNAVVSLVQLWFWCAAMDAHLATGAGQALFGAQQGVAGEAAHQLHGEAESIVRRMLDARRFAALKQQVDEAAGRGELFTATGDAGRNVLSELLSVTKLESLLAIPLSPFNALTGIGKSGDALKELSAVGDRGIELASRYPRLLTWYLQLMVLEIQGHDATRAVLADLHGLGDTMRELGVTTKELPARLRVEAAALLEQSRAAQGTAQETLARAEATAIALDHAAQSLDKLTGSVDAFIAQFRQPPGKPAEPEAPHRPFDITDYTAAIQAAESGAREIRAMVETLSKATKAQELDSRLQVVKEHTDSSVEKAKDDLAGLVDRIFWRAIQLSLVIAVLVLVVRFTARRPGKAIPPAA